MTVQSLSSNHFEIKPRVSGNLPSSILSSHHSHEVIKHYDDKLLSFRHCETVQVDLLEIAHLSDAVHDVDRLLLQLTDLDVDV